MLVPLNRLSVFQSICLLWRRSRRDGATWGGRLQLPKKPFVIAQIRTGPLASPQPPQRAPIDRHRTEVIHALDTRMEVTCLGNWNSRS